MSNLDLITLRNLTGDSLGVTDAACPICGPQRKSPANRVRKVLRVWDDGDFITYKCARCGAAGWATDRASKQPLARPKPKPEPSPDRAELAKSLWSHAKPLSGTAAEAYLRSRRCSIDSDTLRFLPGRGEHPPAMIARFGIGPLTGVHLTKLKPDGSGKAGTEKDKIMIGPSSGQPIMLCDNPDADALCIAEGIEDAASLALVTGWSAWAAGSAGRMAAVVTQAARFSRVFFALDDDPAGHAALAAARAARPDVVPLNIAKALGWRERLDANKALMMFGRDALMAAVEWSAVKADFAHGRIGFHAMQRQISRAEAVFFGLVPDAYA